MLSRLVLEGPRLGAGGEADHDAARRFPQGRAPGNSKSWFLAACFRQLAACGVRGVVAFADPVPRLVDGGRVVAGGHVGHCYQALDARYTGRATARSVTVLPGGSVLNERAKQKVRGGEAGHDGVERRLVALGARPPRPGPPPAQWLAEALDTIGAHHPGCLRFAWALGATRRERDRVVIALPGLRYPKSPDPFLG